MTVPRQWIFFLYKIGYIIRDGGDIFAELKNLKSDLDETEIKELSFFFNKAANMREVDCRRFVSREYGDDSLYLWSPQNYHDFYQKIAEQFDAA